MQPCRGLAAPGEGPGALLVLSLHQGIAAAADGRQHGFRVGVRVGRILGGPGHGQGQDGVLVLATPWLTAETTVGRVLAGKQAGDLTNQGVDQPGTRRPGPVRIAQDPGGRYQKQYQNGVSVTACHGSRCGRSPEAHGRFVTGPDYG